MSYVATYYQQPMALKHLRSYFSTGAVKTVKPVFVFTERGSNQMTHRLNVIQRCQRLALLVSFHRALGLGC